MPWQRKQEVYREMDEFQQKAYGLILGDARKAFDLSQEKDAVRDRYGRNQFGQSRLLARRLVEAGVPFITINDGGWDTHKLFLAVIPGTAYTLASSIEEGKVLEVKPESDTPIVIKVLRKDEVKAGVTITAVRLANGTISTKGVFVAPEKDEAEIVLTVSKDAKVGMRQDMIISGLMRANNQSIVRYARAIPVMVVAK